MHFSTSMTICHLVENISMQAFSENINGRSSPALYIGGLARISTWAQVAEMQLCTCISQFLRKYWVLAGTFEWFV